MNKKLYRSNDRKIAGVCGGLAEYINFDPTVIRVIWALVGLTGAGLVAFLVCAVVIPEKPESTIIDAE